MHHPARRSREAARKREDDTTTALNSMGVVTNMSPKSSVGRMTAFRALTRH
jgi:hypothetical protein